MYTLLCLRLTRLSVAPYHRYSPQALLNIPDQRTIILLQLVRAGMWLFRPRLWKLVLGLGSIAGPMWGTVEPPLRTRRSKPVLLIMST